MKKFLVLICLIFISFTTISCVDTNTTNEATSETTTLIKEITVTDSYIELSKSSEYQIDVSLNFELMDSESLQYSSSNEEIASVTALGKITGNNFGECDITVKYDDFTKVVIHVVVSSEYEIIPPLKTVYKIGEEINTEGALINLYNDNQTLIETVEITKDMIINFNNSESGFQIVNVLYNNVVYGFEVNVLSQKQELSLFNDFILLDNEVNQGEKAEFALLKGNLDEFLLSVNVYDYNEINIYGIFTSPNNDNKKMFGFWYQDYSENLIETSIISTMNTEGKVFDTDRDYDYLVDLDKSGVPHFRLRYIPEEVGDYSVTLVVEVDGDIIQTFEKEFTVNEAVDDDFLGYVRVDESNNRHFVFDSMKSYVPVGQNVGWYTSTQRKHYDFKSWFEQMNNVGMNYARVWMAPWGYSPFWDDLYNYDSRQNRLFSLDKTLEYADEADIYIQLCLLNHGMFSAEVNPMWPNNENQWYISRYGANPYSEIIDDSGEFFSNQEIKDLFKNQLKYIIARYSYSDVIMSFELFNEVDWIETYNAVNGNSWHSEMAEYIKSVDPNKHLITTSQITESFYSSNYMVFYDENIDFISIHRYGIYNHTKYLPDKQNICFEVFNKPVLYDEVGYQGWGGQQQYEADPNNITLHQELWAGALGGGVGTGMNWWWESWIDYYDFYDQYKGIAIYANQMNLVGNNYQVVTSEDQDYDELDVNNSGIGYMGYLVDNRVYLYIYDEAFNLDNQNLLTKTNVLIEIPNLSQGTYSYQAYDTFSGEIIYQNDLTINSSGNYSLSIPSFSEDIAIIFEKIN